MGSSLHCTKQDQGLHLLAHLQSGAASYNNSAAIAGSSLRSGAKLVYYYMFAAAYGASGGCADVSATVAKTTTDLSNRFSSQICRCQAGVLLPVCWRLRRLSKHEWQPSPTADSVIRGRQPVGSGPQRLLDCATTEMATALCCPA